MDPSKFKSGEIEILSKQDGILIELAQIGNKQMLIATDTLSPIKTDQRFRQELYGPDFIKTPLDIIPELISRLLLKRI